MRVVIFGSRYRDASEEEKYLVGVSIWNRVKRLPRDSYVVTGGAPGVDRWAEKARTVQGLDGEVMRAKWRVNGIYNPRAGFERNSRMLEIVPPPDLAIGYWDGTSSGTHDTAKKAVTLGIRVEMHTGGTVIDDWGYFKIEGR